MTIEDPDAPRPHDYTKELRDLELLQRLVRDASRLLNQDNVNLSWFNDRREWNRAAASFVKE